MTKKNDAARAAETAHTASRKKVVQELYQYTTTNSRKEVLYMTFFYLLMACAFVPAIIIGIIDSIDLKGGENDD